MSVMQPGHFRWEEFKSRLEGPEGCNFRYDPEHPDDADKIKWKCGGGTDKTFATAILSTMEGVDVAKSLAFFENHGGYCDCEIILNVLSDEERAAERREFEEKRRNENQEPD